MRVSLINLNFVGQDAIGQCLLHQLRFFRRRGDEVRVYIQHPAEGVPEEVLPLVHVAQPQELLARRDEYFRTCDLYVYHYPSRYALLDTLKTLDRGAVIFYYHNVTPPELWGAQSGVEDLVHGQSGVSKLAPYADLIVTVSPFNADELVRDHDCAPERIRVLPLAVPLDTFHPGPADPALLRRWELEGQRVILFVGRVAGNKRIDLLIEALALVRQQVPNAKLLVVGDERRNPAFAEVLAGLRSRAAALGVADSAIFTGRVDDVAPYYRLASVYASASLHEGFGVPLIEAMASGVPVVASRATAHPWVVGEAGLLCEPGDAGDLAAKITQLLTDDGVYGDLVRRGLARARDFSLEHYTIHWGRIVDEVAAWLADRPWPAPAEGRPVPAQAGRGLPDLLTDDLEQLEKAAGAVLQPYVVRSGVPLAGPLIAWTRRNLTSHLREPYLDPTLRRQERFNWQVAQVLRQVGRLLHQLQTGQRQTAELERRVEQLEGQMAKMLEYLAARVEQLQQEPDAAARAAGLAALRQELDDLRDQSS